MTQENLRKTATGNALFSKRHWSVNGTVQVLTTDKSKNYTNHLKIKDDVIEKISKRVEYIETVENPTEKSLSESSPNTVSIQQFCEER